MRKKFYLQKKDGIPCVITPWFDKNSYDIMRQSIQEWTKENLWKVPLGSPYYFKFFKGCLPQILLGPILNTWIPRPIYS